MTPFLSFWVLAALFYSLYLTGYMFSGWTQYLRSPAFWVVIRDTFLEWLITFPFVFLLNLLVWPLVFLLEILASLEKQNRKP